MPSQSVQPVSEVQMGGCDLKLPAESNVPGFYCQNLSSGGHLEVTSGRLSKVKYPKKDRKPVYPGGPP